jgi:hypothetical protein
MKDNKFGFRVVENRIYHFETEIFKKWQDIIDHRAFHLITSYKDQVHYFSDEKHIYICSSCYYRILEKAIQNKFQIIDKKNGISYDGENYFWYDEIFPFDYSLAKRINEYYLQIGDKIIYNNKEAKGVEAKSFSIIWDNFARDVNYLIFRNQIQEDVDIETFKQVPGCFDQYHTAWDHTYYAFDKNNVYFMNTVVSEIKRIRVENPISFYVKIINDKLFGFYEDGIYYFGKKKRNSPF